MRKTTKTVLELNQEDILEAVRVYLSDEERVSFEDADCITLTCTKGTISATATYEDEE